MDKIKNWRESKGLDRFPYMMGFLEGRRTFYFLGLLMMCSYGFLSDVLAGQLYQVVTDWEGGMPKFTAGLIRVAILLVAVVLIAGIGVVLNTYATASADRRMRASLVRALTRMPLSAWYKRHSGDWLTVLGKDADNAAEFYKGQCQRLCGSLISIVGGMILLFSTSLPLALFSITVGCLYMGVGMICSKSMKKYSAIVRAAAGRVSEQVSNQVGGVWAARFYRIGALLSQKHTGAADETFHASKKMAGVRAGAGALQAFGYTLCYSGALIVGLLLVYAGKLELPQMLALWPISLGASFSLADLGFFVTDLQPMVTAADRMKAVLALPAEQGGRLTQPPAKEPAVALQDVSFSYDGEKKALSEVSLTVRAGERVAFVGESGSGKTTLMKLLMRMFDPASGEVRVFGAPAQDYALPALRGQFAYVPQSARLIAGSIQENLLLVKPDADEGQMREAARRAYADAFIQALPAGYDTDAGESGAHLSGGQRQRVAIARAFLKDAPILIFDEVTASLDGESEEAISRALREAGRDKTLLLITHRLSTALIADRIVVMDGGRIIEEGTHADLLQRDGAYARLWRMQ